MESSGKSSTMHRNPNRITASKRPLASAFKGNRRESPSIILFLSVILMVNLCSFHSDFQQPIGEQALSGVKETTEPQQQLPAAPPLKSATSMYADTLESCLRFVKLMFTNPIRLGKRTTRFTLAEAKMLGKVAKVLYFKKKIKKLGKKLKKKTIAVPVFTAIPIYEHSYYPSPHVTHVSHGGGHMHHAAASSPVASQQLAASASSHSARASYASLYSPAAHQIINAYQPSPPVYVDHNGGLYGTYGNAYGRYDGGYHMW